MVMSDERKRAAEFFKVHQRYAKRVDKAKQDCHDKIIRINLAEARDEDHIRQKYDRRKK